MEKLVTLGYMSNIIIYFLKNDAQRILFSLCIQTRKLEFDFPLILSACELSCLYNPSSFKVEGNTITRVDSPEINSHIFISPALSLTRTHTIKFKIKFDRSGIFVGLSGNPFESLKTDYGYYLGGKNRNDYGLCSSGNFYKDNYCKLTKKHL